MANENNFQNEEFVIYQIDTVLTTKRWLEDKATTLCSKDVVKRPQGGGSQPTGKSAEDISKFLGVINWSNTKVKELLKMSRDLHPEILKEMQNAPNRGNQYRTITFTNKKPD